MAIGKNNMDFTAIRDVFAKLRKTSFFEGLNCGIQDSTTKISSCTNYFVKETNDSHQRLMCLIICGENLTLKEA